jgi:hypothetical protein
VEDRKARNSAPQGRRQKPNVSVGRAKPQGQALVEFALMLPLLMLLLVGVVDFGRVAYALVTVSNASFHSAVWASEHLKQGATPCAGRPSITENGVTICCPLEDNVPPVPADFPDVANPTYIREVVVRDFLIGLPYTPTCAAADSTVSSTCNPAVSCTPQIDGYTYSGTRQFFDVVVRVTYRWTAIGPYGPLLGSFDIDRGTKVRYVP